MLTFWSCKNNGLIRNNKVNSKIYDVTGCLTITIHTLPNIAQSSGNQTMKSGLIIKYNRNIFLQKCDRETSSRTLYRKGLYEQGC